MPISTLTPDVLALDCAAEADRIGARVARTIGAEFRRRGAVVALSGGVDSSVCAAVVARAIGPKKVLAFLLPIVGPTVTLVFLIPAILSRLACGRDQCFV